MISICALGSSRAAARYHTSELTARERYYLLDPHGSIRWMGSGARALGLGALYPVTGKAVEAILDGYTPDRMRALVQLQKGREHQPGWDATVSAPKSLSVTWAVSDARGRKLIETVHRDSVQAVVDYLEQEAAVTRRGKGGARTERVGMVVVAASHAVSRAGDPQLHEHLLIANTGVRADGSWGTLKSIELYRHKLAAGAIYRAALARNLQQLGLTVRRELRGKFTSIEVEGVPRELCKALSSRRTQIEQALEKKGLSSARAAEVAALETRPRKKRHDDPEALRARWVALGEEHGFGRKEAAALLGLEPKAFSRVEHTANGVDIAAQEFAPPKESLGSDGMHGGVARGQDPAPRLRRREAKTSSKSETDSVFGHAVTEAVKKMGLRFERRDVHLAVASALAHRGIATKELVQRANDALDSLELERSETVPPIYTRRSAAIEKLCSAGRDDNHPVPTPSAPELAGKYARALSENPSRMCCLDSSRHDGPDQILTEVAAIYRRAGYKVLAVTPTKVEAHRLYKQTGIQAESRLYFEERLGYTSRDHAANAARQLGRALLRKRAFNLQPLKVTEKTLVIVDRAEQFAPQSLDRLLLGKARRAKFILSGDSRGDVIFNRDGAFRELCKELPTVEVAPAANLPAWRVLGEHLLANGETRDALSLFSANGAVSVSPGSEQALAQALKAWRAKRREKGGALLVADSESSARTLNNAAQTHRRRRGELGLRSVRRAHATFRTYDQVRFRRGNRALELKAGATGTIESIRREAVVGPFDRTVVTVRLHEPRRVGWLRVPRPKRVRLTAKGLDAVELGYAVDLRSVQAAEEKSALFFLGSSEQKRPPALLRGLVKPRRVLLRH